jgi:AcrR family transcriptional regulator
MSESVKKVRTPRNPELTRARILEAAGKLLAKDGPEGLSVSQVARLAGINRGTAYQHFRTREQLLRATTNWVSERLCTEVFRDLDTPLGQGYEVLGSQLFIEHLIDFAMKYPELGRVWLFEVLSSSDPSDDPFWALYKTKCDEFAASEFAQPNIDTEVQAATVLMSAFLWPVWARSHAKSEDELKQMSKRFSKEMLRLSLHGTVRPGKSTEPDDSREASIEAS